MFGGLQESNILGDIFAMCDPNIGKKFLTEDSGIIYRAEMPDVKSGGYICHCIHDSEKKQVIRYPHYWMQFTNDWEYVPQFA